MVRVRRFQPDDLKALYDISLGTGHEGGDASNLYTDGRLLGHIYAAPYGLLAAELAFVIEDELGVAGFVVGALNTSTWEAQLERDWWPALRLHYPDPDIGSSDAWTLDQKRAFMIHHPARTPPNIVDRYPAHLHMNLLPRVQGRGLGSTLLATWVDAAANQEVLAIHVGVNRNNRRAARFWSAKGFDSLCSQDAATRRTLWMGVVAKGRPV